MLQHYTPVAGDVVALDAGDATRRTVGSVETIGTCPKARCTWLFNGQTQSGDFDLGCVHIVSSATGAALFTTTAGGGNTGTGAVNSGAITNGEQWVADTYTLTFTSTSAWTLKNSSNVQIASGSYSNPTTIAFLGVTVAISGAPAANDTFTVTAAQP